MENNKIQSSNINSSLQLECSNCRVCLTIHEWNKTAAKSVILGTINSLIPEDLFEIKDWEKWKIENGGRLDCPECGEISLIDDMEAY